MGGRRSCFQSLKQGEEKHDLMFRVFNVSSEAATMKVKPLFQVDQVYESTIIEEMGETLSPDEDERYALKVGPATIQTLGMQTPAR